jgi:uncharacterized repeat protein (TIGR01451 family)
MNTSIQHPGPNGIVQPSGDSSRSEGTLSAWRKLPGRFTFVALLAGLLLLLFSAPAARAQQVPPGCQGSGLGIFLDAPPTDSHIGCTIWYGVTIFNGGTGPKVYCDASNIVAYVVTPNGVSHPLLLGTLNTTAYESGGTHVGRTYLSNGQWDYYSNVVSYVISAPDLVPDGMGGFMVRATATDIGIILQNDRPSSSTNEQGVNTEVSMPCIHITVSCTNSVGENGAINYSGTVTNCGNTMLVGVTITNFVNGVRFPVAFLPTLNTNQVASFSGSWIPLNPCILSTAIFTAQAGDIFTNCPQTVTSSASTTCQNSLIPQIKVTKVCPDRVVPGQPLIFSGSVSNAGNVTLTNIVVVNNQPVPNTQVFTWPSLAPGAVLNFDNSANPYLAPTNCSVTDILTATGRSICGAAVTNTTGPVICTISTTPQITVTAACPTAPVVPGGLVNYSVTVQNIGNITLSNVVVVSDQPGPPNNPLFTVPSLAPGASANFTAGPYTVPANACMVTNTFTATGKDLCTTNTVTSSFQRFCTVITAPAIAVKLNCPSPTLPAVPGGLIIYTGTVTNSGNVILNNVIVVDGQSGTVLPVGSLSVHASAPFTVTNTAPTNACSVSGTVTVMGNDYCTQLLVTNTASTTNCPLNTTASITVTKTCPQQPSVPPGFLLTFSGSVSNTGNITVTNIVVVNNQPTNNTPVITVASLAPGAVTNFTRSYVAPTNCSVTDTLIATGRSICGAAVTSYGSNTCPILTTPAIVVTVYCPTNPVGQGGSLLYSGTVSNAGNITLTNIIVVNNWPYSNVVVFTTPSLAPGATTNFSGSYPVPLNCCQAWLWFVASGQGCDGFTVTDTDSGTCTVFTSPRIVVTKVCDPRRRLLQPGDTLHYSGTISNAGNITLFNVTVVDNQPLPNTFVFGPTILAPGQSAGYTGSYTVLPDFCGADTVTASGQDVCSYALVTTNVTATCPIATSPRIGVTKQCPTNATPHGGQLIFSGTVTNMGNVTLDYVYVVNDQPSNNAPVIGPISLAPGGFLNFTGSYTAPLVCCEIIDTLTARGKDRCSGSNVTAYATAICPTLYTPGIALVQLLGICPPNGLPIGSSYEFSGFVTNTGDAILTNVLVSISGGQPCPTNFNLPSLAPIDGQLPLPLLGPFDLAPGQSAPYSGCLIVTSNICAVTITAISQDTCASTPVTFTITCPVAVTLGINIEERCPQDPTGGQVLVTNGSTVFFDSRVCNTGNVPLNIVVFSGQPSIILPLGPITLAPGDCTNFTGSYIATGGSNPVTNSITVTHPPGDIWATVTNVITATNTVTFTTNAAIPFWFGTINSVGVPMIVDRFPIGSSFNGLVYAPEDHGEPAGQATEFYTMRKDIISGMSFFDTIIASTAAVNDRFGATTRNFKALTYAADNVGYGPLLFYYLSRDAAGLTWFGTITPGAPNVGVTADLFTVGTNTTFDVLTYTAGNVGYGAEMFYYIRHDTNGVSWFGTINPTPGGIVTDRFTVGTNTTFVGLTFTDLVAPGYGDNNFYYLRQDTNGVTTFGTLHLTQPPTPPISAVVTDRFPVGINAVELAYTFDNPAFGANLFYFLRGRNFSVTSNSVTTYGTNAVTFYTTNLSSRLDIYTTNIVVSFTPTNTVTVIGTDICKDIVTAAADCFGPVGPNTLVIGTPNVNVDGNFSLTFPTVDQKLYYVQYKDALLDPAWINLPGMPVTGTGAPLTISDPDPVVWHPSRFYRIMTP